MACAFFSLFFFAVSEAAVLKKWRASVRLKKRKTTNPVWGWGWGCVEVLCGSTTTLAAPLESNVIDFRKVLSLHSSTSPDLRHVDPYSARTSIFRPFYVVYTRRGRRRVAFYGNFGGGGGGFHRRQAAGARLIPS